MENVSHCKRMKAISASMIYIYHLHIIGIYIINLLLVNMIKFHFDIINIFLNYSNMKKNLKKRELSYQLLIITKHNKADDVQIVFCNGRVFHLDARCRGKNFNDSLLYAFVECRRWTGDLRNFASVGFQLLRVFDFCTLKIGIRILKFFPANEFTERDVNSTIFYFQSIFSPRKLASKKPISSTAIIRSRFFFSAVK
ncbi:hypothetical protein T08_2548 [Trichinella sp. T8]|nr:hypothetical protein T08_2548 [Trichinella sp. T8]